VARAPDVGIPTPHAGVSDVCNRAREDAFCAARYANGMLAAVLRKYFRDPRFMALRRAMPHASDRVERFRVYRYYSG
jgi:hypothetical protein